MEQPDENQRPVSRITMEQKSPVTYLFRCLHWRHNTFTYQNFWNLKSFPFLGDFGNLGQNHKRRSLKTT